MTVRFLFPHTDRETLVFAADLAEDLRLCGHECVVSESTDGNGITIAFCPGEETERILHVRAATREERARLVAAVGGVVNVTTLSVYGLTAEEAGARLKGISRRNVKVSTEPNFLGVYVRIRYTDRATKVDVDEIADACVAALGDAVYSREETTLESHLIKAMLLGGRRVSVAESFTGGGISAKLTSAPRSSEVVKEGIVAYTEEAKVKRLGVQPQTLAFDSAVSVNCVYQMATGLLAEPDADIAVATTGYAGPTGQDVGKCFIAVGDRERINVFDYRFEGDRAQVTEAGVRAALLRLAEYILK